MYKFQERDGFRGQKDILICKTAIFQPKAEFAATLIHEWAQSDAIDGDGTADEIVRRAFEIVDALWAVAKERGEILELPEPTPPRLEPREAGRGGE